MRSSLNGKDEVNNYGDDYCPMSVINNSRRHNDNLQVRDNVEKLILQTFIDIFVNVLLSNNRYIFSVCLLVG